MSIDNTPKQNEYKGLEQFRFWCQHVLPLAYDDSLSYYELLCKVVSYLNDTMENVMSMGKDVTHMFETYKILLDWINSYFDNLDVQNEINNKLNIMASDGTLSVLFKPMFDTYKSEIDSLVHIQNDYIGVLQERMNSFTTLANGSTTGDAELIDARVDYSGHTWDNVGEHIRGVGNQLAKGVADVVTLSNYTTKLPNANEGVGTYLLVFDTNTDIPILNMPFSKSPSTICKLESVKAGSYTHQILHSGMSSWERLGGSGGFENWKLKGSPSIVVNSKNYESVLSDCDNAKDGSIYFINFAQRSDASMIANLPFSAFPDDLILLETFASASYGQQLLSCTGKKIVWRRRKVGTWLAWEKLIDFETNDLVERLSITVGEGGDYTKLTDALAFANTRGKVDMYVLPGTYDIVAELGVEYWSNYIGYANSDYMNMGKDNRYIFSPNAKVVCHYTGDNTIVNTYFSPFNSLGGLGSFTIDGLVLDVSGCRYAVHDDISGANIQETHVYKNCQITCDRNCIGGGFGSNLIVLIENCIFNGTVSWHNAKTVGCNKLVVKDCVFEAGKLSLGYYGEYATQSIALVSNNKFVLPIETRFETTDSTFENIKLIEWNNVII